MHLLGSVLAIFFDLIAANKAALDAKGVDGSDKSVCKSSEHYTRWSSIFFCSVTAVVGKACC